MHLQRSATFNYSQYVCGQQYTVFAWASNAYGQSAFSLLNNGDPYTTPDCYS
jgi:hypothetical protein